MRTAIAFSVLVLLAASAFAAGAGDATVLAEWNGGKVTVADYAHWWERIDPAGRPSLATQDEKAEFLNTVINAMVMLQEAKARGEDKNPNVTEWAAGRRVNALRERLYQEATEGRLQVDSTEVNEMYERRLTQINASHIVCRTYAKASALLDSLKAGASFEDLARKYSTDPSGARGGHIGPVRWGDFSDRWCVQAFALAPGEISQPFEVENGYAIVKVNDKIMIKPQDADAEKEAIRNGLLQRANFAEREAFLDSLRIAYDVNIDLDAVIDICARYVTEMTSRGITSEVVAEDIVLPLTDREKSLPVASFRGRTFDYEDAQNFILAQPYVVRPNLDDPDQVFGFINRQLNDSLLVREAEKRGIDKIPEIADELEKALTNRILTRFYRVMTLDTEVPEDTLRAFYVAHRESYYSLPGHVASKIVLPTQEAADSVLAMIRAGASFEDIARERSMDPFTAPEGGDMGFYSVGQDPEFDGFFAQMQVGDMAVFRSVEGHVVLWLRERRERQPLTFEVARPAVERDVSRRARQTAIGDWVSAKRKELGVKVYADRLAQVNL
jgi:peptidyl-prolyl cis-trans isomerase C